MDNVRMMSLLVGFMALRTFLRIMMLSVSGQSRLQEEQSQVFSISSQHRWVPTEWNESAEARIKTRSSHKGECSTHIVEITANSSRVLEKVEWSKFYPLVTDRLRVVLAPKLYEREFVKMAIILVSRSITVDTPPGPDR